MFELCSFCSSLNAVRAPAVVRSLLGMNWRRAEQDVSRVSLLYLSCDKNSVEVNRPTKQHQQKLLKVLQRDKWSIVEKEGETGRKNHLFHCQTRSDCGSLCGLKAVICLLPL